MAIFNQVVSGGGSAPSGKYQLLQRVTDDNNNEIGTVCGFHTDANNVEYAVVCLDAQYRSDSKKILSDNVGVTGMVRFTGYNMFATLSTATEICDTIMAFVGDGSVYTSPAVSHCRGLSFTIDNVVYLGQVPTVKEISYMLIYQDAINSADPGGTGALRIGANNIWSCQEADGNGASGWFLTNFGFGSGIKGNAYQATPVLELPNA